MGAKLPLVVSNTILGSPVVTTAETVICTSPPFSPPLDFAAILILVMLAFTAGASATSYGAKLRRGTTIAGAVVDRGFFNNLCTAASLVGSMLWYFDSPGGVGGQQYSLTLQMAAATGNTTINDVAMLVFAL